MYPVIAFRLPARPGLSDKDVIEAYVEWIEKSPYHTVSSSELFERASSQEAFTLQTAMLTLQGFTADGTRYISVQLDNPYEESGLLWRTECIFAREAAEGARGVFHIRLSRRSLSEDRPHRRSAEPKLPYIVTVLRDKKMVAGEAVAGSTYSVRQPEWFPLVVCAEKAARFRSGYSAARYLREKLGPMARVLELDASGHAFPLPDGLACGESDIVVLYPAAGVQAIYRGIMADEYALVVLRRIVLDVMHWVSGLQDSSTLRWSEVCPPQESNPYCIMNQRMAEFLRLQRRQQGMSQQTLAGAVESTGLIISRLETLRMQRVSRELLSRIESALGLPKNAIIGLQDSQADPVPAVSPAAPPAGLSIPETAAELSPQKSTYCRRCGHHLYQDSQFCPSCGTKVLD